MSGSSGLSLNALYDLSGRIALVTGGGSGIGLMIARGLATNGAKVYISGRRKEALEKAAKSLDSSAKGSLYPLPMDVTYKASILEGVKAIEQQEGKLHILVNNSGQVGPVSSFFNDLSSPEHKEPGTLGRALFDNESFESWSDVYRVNTFSIFFVTTAFLGLLSKGSEDSKHWQSSVVNITSISGVMRLAQNHFAYNSGKAASSHLTRILATEFALKGVPVRVNAVAPGVYATEMTQRVIPDPESVSVEQTNKVGQTILPVPAGRPGNAQEVSGIVIYLVSPAGCYTNGQEIIIDGGYLAVNPSTR
ncbi:short-chain dehydrogenase [Fomitiporia mediterranea MF3/22]|uniref:short-chain dehydrogenase n=1 Tax=Fomitiporia mediterranea (strain MF3/22) TaxID=694068 RepID=UPI000440954D|nr:short-chain dehydrogenase [Fomitiporia mediterranea MF3/22]EJC97899.1 short-chain dehydrogenase [Fomitiporia mediterranea MF3/22]